MSVGSRALVAATALLLAACGDNPTSPTDTSSSSSTTTTPVASFFELTISPGSDRFYAFPQSQSGSVGATLASVTVGKSPAAVPMMLRLGVGVPAGEGCSLLSWMDVTPSLTTQLTVTLAPGTYCIDVADIGGLSADAMVSVRLSHT